MPAVERPKPTDFSLRAAPASEAPRFEVITRTAFVKSVIRSPVRFE